MAAGVDTIAHQIALHKGGRTVAVWGSGLDCIYPPQNTSLALKIVQQGAILTQFPLGTHAQSFTFPQRNRLIAGLAQAVVITEALPGSGALLTAQAATDYGKPVFVLPSSIFSPASVTVAKLVALGAHLVVDAAAIVDIVGGEPTLNTPNHAPSLAASPQETRLLTLLQAGSAHIDQLVRQSGLTPAEVSTALVTLELHGQIKNLSRGEYRRM